MPRTEINQTFLGSDYAHLKGSSPVRTVSVKCFCYNETKGRFLLIKITYFKLLFAYKNEVHPELLNFTSQIY